MTMIVIFRYNNNNNNNWTDIVKYNLCEINQLLNGLYKFKVLC